MMIAAEITSNFASTSNLSFDACAANLPTPTYQDSADRDATDQDTLPETEAPVPAECDAQTPEPFTISADGHYVGLDGFVVPKDFTEFYERFPRHIGEWVRRHCYYASGRAEAKDRESSMILHILSIPQDSIYRTPGYNGHAHGCTDRVMTFSPERCHGANRARFFYYINGILRNHLNTILRREQIEPTGYHRTIDIKMLLTNADTDVHEDDLLYSLAYETYRQACRIDIAMESTVEVDEFRSFVEEYNSELIPVLDAMVKAETLVEARDVLGLSGQMFNRARTRLRTLHECMESGRPVPSQRKVYTRRAQAQVAVAAIS
jgi:hypothetical protein